MLTMQLNCITNEQKPNANSATVELSLTRDLNRDLVRLSCLLNPVAGRLWAHVQDCLSSVIA